MPWDEPWDMTPEEEAEYLSVAKSNNLGCVIAVIVAVIAIVGFGVLAALWLRHFFSGEWLG